MLNIKVHSKSVKHIYFKPFLFCVLCIYNYYFGITRLLKSGKRFLKSDIKILKNEKKFVKTFLNRIFEFANYFFNCYYYYYIFVIEFIDI